MVKKTKKRPKKKPRPNGRPTKYCGTLNTQAYKLCLLGATDAEMAHFFGVAERTINNWKKSKHGFLQSLKKGKVVADANVAESLYKRACGYEHKDSHFASYEGEIISQEYTKRYPPDTAAAFIWLKNRAGWSDVKEVKAQVSLAAAIKEALEDDSVS